MSWKVHRCTLDVQSNVVGDVWAIWYGSYIGVSLMYSQYLWYLHQGLVYKISVQVGSYIDVTPMYHQWQRQVHWWVLGPWMLAGALKHHGCTTNVVGLYIRGMVTNRLPGWAIHWCTTNRDGIYIGGWVYKITHQIGLYIGAPPIGMTCTLGMRLQNHPPGWSVHWCTTNRDGQYIGGIVTKSPTRLVCALVHHQLRWSVHQG